MRKTFFGIAFFALICCSSEHNHPNDFIDKVIDLTIENSSGDFVEFPGLYDTLAGNIPDDKDEKLMLVERLKQREFEVTNWGRGNMPPLGPRIIDIELRKGDCICSVSKMYYATTYDTLFQMAEGISCKREIKEK